MIAWLIVGLIVVGAVWLSVWHSRTPGYRHTFDPTCPNCDRSIEWREGMADRQQDRLRDHTKMCV